MNSGRMVFVQLLDLLPRRAFESAIARYGGEKKLRRFSCLDQLLCMVFAQLTGRSSLRETVSCLRALGSRRYHCGIRVTPARSTLAEANERRDFRIFMDTAMSMIASARMELPVDADLKRLKIHAFAIDSTTIDPCLKLFPWALFRLRGPKSRRFYPDTLRRVRFIDPVAGKRLTFLTNHLTLDALSIALLYRKRWKIELLFKWMKQHLHIKAFFGTTPNAVKTQLWIAVLVYVLIHRLKHRHGLSQTPNEIAQILSVMIFEKTPINQVFSEIQQKNDEGGIRNQLMLFDL